MLIPKYIPNTYTKTTKQKIDGKKSVNELRRFDNSSNFSHLLERLNRFSFTYFLLSITVKTKKFDLNSFDVFSMNFSNISYV